MYRRLTACTHIKVVALLCIAQILMNRMPEDQYDYLDLHPRHVMIPHRLMAYPPDVSLAVLSICSSLLHMCMLALHSQPRFLLYYIDNNNVPQA